MNDPKSMLLNDFYTLHDLSHRQANSGGTITAAVVLNASHKIFEGHFPDLPVVPGVCMMQIIKEVMEFVLGKQFLIRSAAQIKFLSVITPKEYTQVMTEIQFQAPSEKEMDIAAKLYLGNITFFKLKARLESQ